jgi:hypothetical protein
MRNIIRNIALKPVKSAGFIFRVNSRYFTINRDTFMTTNANNPLSGTKYQMRRKNIERLKEDGYLDVLIFHPAKRLDRVVLRPEPGDINLMYEVIIATDNGDAVELAVRQFMQANSQEETTRFSITRSASRLKDPELRGKYPLSIRVATKVGVPFDYADIISRIPKDIDCNYHLSTPYNSGLYPVTNLWFEIPQEYQKDRNAKIHSIRSTPVPRFGRPHIESIREYDVGLFHELRSKGVDITTHLGAYFLDHSTDNVDAVDPRYSVCIPANQSLNRENPVIERMTVVGMDCLPIGDAAKYADLVGLGHHVNPNSEVPKLYCQSGIIDSDLYKNRPFSQTPPFFMASKVSRNSGMFTFYQTCLESLFQSLRFGRDPSMSVSCLRYYCNTLLVQRIRIVYDPTTTDTKSVKGEI